MRLNLSAIASALVVLSTSAVYEVSAGEARPELSPAPSKSRPNIIFILADDLGYGDVGCYNPKARFPTPHIDRLAAQGIRFTDAHAQSICTPTRYSILTGRYHWRTWLHYSVLFPFEPPLIDRDRLTLPGLLQGNDYRTGCIGKWHLGWRWQGQENKPFMTLREDGSPTYERTSMAARMRLLQMSAEVDYSAPIEEGPTTRGFDYYFGEGVINQPPFAWIENDRYVETPVMYQGKGTKESVKAADPNRWNWEADPRPVGHASISSWSPWDVLQEQSRRAVTYIREQTQDQAPYFLYLPLTAVHQPIVPTPDFQGKTSSSYGDFVFEMDWVVGQVSKAVEESGQRDNTIIIFMSDNGGSHRLGGSNHPWRGQKGGIHEGGHRVPTLVSWPDNLPADMTCSHLFSCMDFFRTLASLLDIPVPNGAAPDSLDFSAVLRDPTSLPAVRTTLVHRNGVSLFAIRKDDWKLIIPSNAKAIVSVRREKFQLFNLRKDPEEVKNVAAANPEVVDKLYLLLRTLREKSEREVYRPSRRDAVEQEVQD